MKNNKKNDRIHEKARAAEDSEVIELKDSPDADDAEIIELTDSPEEFFSEQEKITEPDTDDEGIAENSDRPVLLDDIAGEILTGDEELAEFDPMMLPEDIAEEDIMEDEDVIDLDTGDITDPPDIIPLLPEDISAGDERELSDIENEPGENRIGSELGEDGADEDDEGDIIPLDRPEEPVSDEDDGDFIELDEKSISAPGDSDEPMMLRESVEDADENGEAPDFDENEATMIAPPDSDEMILLRDTSDRPGEDGDMSDSEDEATLIAPPDSDETILLRDTAEKDEDMIALEDEATMIAPPDSDEMIFLGEDSGKQALKDEDIIDLEEAIIAPSDADETIFLGDYPDKQSQSKNERPLLLTTDSDDEATMIAPPDLEETVFLGDESENNAKAKNKPLSVLTEDSDDEATMIAPPDLDDSLFETQDDEDIIDLDEEAALIAPSDADETIFLGDEVLKREEPAGDSDDEATIIAPPDLDETIFLGDEVREQPRKEYLARDSDDEATIIAPPDLDESDFLEDEAREHPGKNQSPDSEDEATVIAPPDLDGSDFLGEDFEKADQQDDEDIIDLNDEEAIISPDLDETIFIQDVARKAVRQKEEDIGDPGDSDGTILFQDEAKKASETLDNIIELNFNDMVSPLRTDDPASSGEAILRPGKETADSDSETIFAPTEFDDIIRNATVPESFEKKEESPGEFLPDRPEDTGTPLTDIEDVIRLADKASADFKPVSESSGKKIGTGSKAESQRPDKDLSDLIEDEMRPQPDTLEPVFEERAAEKDISEIPQPALPKADSGIEYQPSDSKAIQKESDHQKSPDSAPRSRLFPDSVSLPPPEQLEAILEQVIKKVFSEKMFSEKIENKLVEVIEKAVANEMDRLKDVLFEDLADED